jgi:hypothetical protein
MLAVDGNGLFKLARVSRQYLCFQRGTLATQR